MVAPCVLVGCEADRGASSELSRARPNAEVESARADIGVAAGANDPRTWVVEADLVADAQRAHVRRHGPILDPRGPGWARVAQVGERDRWLPKRGNEPAGLAWPEGISAVLNFPVGEEGPRLKTGSLFAKGIAAGQRVSIFLDEKPIGTVPVPMTGRRITFSLPEGGLAPGEHRLRLWFAFTRFVGKRRTPGALGPVTFSPEAVTEEPPKAWTAERGEGPEKRGALLAGAPASWTFYLWAPPDARFVADMFNVGPAPLEFVVRVQQDGETAERLGATRVEPGGEGQLELPLGRFSGQPLRLVLETTGETAPLETAGWLGARVEALQRGVDPLPPVRNVVVWTVDGLRSDRVGLGRAGEFPATPNLDLLRAEGAAMVDVWSGGASPDDGHRSLIEPWPGAPTLAAVAATRSRFSAYFGTSTGVEPSLTGSFTTAQDLRRTGEPDETRVILRELDAWLDVRKKNPFFVYLSSAEPRRPHATPAPGYQRLYARRREAEAPVVDDVDAERAAATLQRHAEYDAQVTAADYWIGQLVSVLTRRGVLHETAIVVVGTVGQDLDTTGLRADGAKLTPDLLRVPVVVWHPDRIADSPRPLARGGTLVDVAGLVAELLGAGRPEAWRAVPLGHTLFDGSAMPLRPASARLGAQVAGRWGDWWLHASSRGVVLWNVADAAREPADVSPTHPITLRLLRDGLVDAARPTAVVGEVRTR
ncbi:MAG: sulfatase-like hydrolase/transferase [Bradymonadia bacterium]